VIDPRFSYDHFVQSTDRDALAHALAHELTRSFRDATISAPRACCALIDELRALGRPMEL
jgi:hypothetical protein